jgi:flagellar biosynthesis protein
MPERPAVTAALRYTGSGAPEVIAAGRGELADRILARAHEAGVPVHRDPELADSLARLALGAEVPEELWLAVAEVLAWAYSLRSQPITPKR